jgi:hypothetical protein
MPPAVDCEGWSPDTGEGRTFWGGYVAGVAGARGLPGEGGVPAVEVVDELFVEDSAADL